MNDLSYVSEPALASLQSFPSRLSRFILFGSSSSLAPQMFPEVNTGKLSHNTSGTNMAASSADATSDSELESVKNLTDISEIQKALEKLNVDEVCIEELSCHFHSLFY